MKNVVQKHERPKAITQASLQPRLADEAADVGERVGGRVLPGRMSGLSPSR